MLQLIRTSDNLRFIGALLFLAALTVIAYAPVMDAGSIIDDEKYYINDPLVNASDGLFSIWLKPFQNNGVWPYIPITRSTFWLERQIGGLNLAVGHWGNVLFHCLAAALLGMILRFLHVRGALIISFCFALHPIHVQSVAWITERKNVVAAVFFFLTLWGFVNFEKKKKTTWYWLTLAFYAGALLSKTSTIMLPLIFVILRYWQRTSWSRTDFQILLPFFLLAGGAGSARIWFEIHAFGAVGEAYTRSFLERLLTAGHIPFFYLSKIVFPHPLIFTYPKWVIDPGHFFLYFPLLGLFVTMLLLLLKYRSWGSPIFLGLAAYGVLLFPVMGFFNNAWTKFSFVTDHWVYLPSIPLVILLLQGVLQFLDYFKKFKFHRIGSAGLGMLFILFLGGMTWHQASIYENRKTLWQTTIQDNPNSWLAYGELARAYTDDRQFEQALQNYSKALAIRKYPEAFHNRALTYFNLNRYDLALGDYNQALRLNPKYTEAYFNRGNVNFRMNRFQAAFADYNKTLSLNAKYVDAYFNRGLIHFRLNRFESAYEDYSRTLSLSKDYTEAYFNRGLSSFKMKKYEQALIDFNQTLALDSDYVEAYFNRGNSYFSLMRYEEALLEYKRVLSLDPRHINAYFNRGYTLSRMERYDEAIADFSKALSLNPEYANAYNNRGLSHNALNHHELACTDWQNACRLGLCQIYLEAKSRAYCQ
ncbi:MAG: tetratricopeptide repeat protein [SAR324 cluster bacterium]|nr:tetratricopeptide repeat protein [SAR324 cluster bacterium]